MESKYWTPVARDYDAIKAGSIDGTDVIPHDRAILRAVAANYKPNKGVVGDPQCSIFIGRLNHVTTEDVLHQIFSTFGQIKRLRLVRDIITGFSKGYAFVEFYDSQSTQRARRDANKMTLDDKEILVDYECERTMKGWIPRRLGGGFGGRKEAGQLRFGGRERPYRKPIIFPIPNKNARYPNASEDLRGDEVKTGSAFNPDLEQDMDRRDARRYDDRSRDRTSSRRRSRSVDRIGSRDGSRDRSRSRERRRDRSRSRRRSRNRSRSWHRRRSREKRQSSGNRDTETGKL